MNYVYSTQTCGMHYAEYEKSSSKDIAKIIKKVLIKGGHGVANKHFLTPKGVVTTVSDEDMEFLLKSEAFNRHLKAGFMSYDKKEVLPEIKAANMKDKDGSAPLTPADFIESDNSSDSSKIYRKKGAQML